MKKALILLSVLTLAQSGFAASIRWGAGTGTARNVYEGTTLMSTANGYSVTAYLIYLGDNATGWGAFDPTDLSSATVAQSVSVTTAGALLPSAGTTVNADAYTDGSATFGIFYLASISGGTFADGTTVDHYYMTDFFVYDSTNPEKGTWTDGTSTYQYTEAVPSGSVWTPVPEPATAALALAGLALLIRRRR